MWEALNQSLLVCMQHFYSAPCTMSIWSGARMGLRKSGYAKGTLFSEFLQGLVAGVLGCQWTMLHSTVPLLGSRGHMYFVLVASAPFMWRMQTPEGEAI